MSGLASQSDIEWCEAGFPPLPTDWKAMTVDEIKSTDKKSIISGPFGSNISSKYFVVDGVPVVRGNNLSLGLGEKFKDDGFVYITPEKANELNTWASKNDLIFTAVGTIGQVGLLRGNEKFEKYIISNKQLRLTVNKTIIDPLFAYYWFASEMMVDQIIQRNTGSSVPLINLSVLKSLVAPVPPQEEQKAIASVLSSLDDKIDLLHRQNKTLEAMAETLFRQWFVEEAQEDWEILKLGDCVTISYGKNLPTKKLLPDGYPVFGANGQIGFYERYTYEDPQVLVSCRGEASGKVNISLPKSFVTNNSLALERNKRQEISFEFLKYWALSYDFKLHVSGSAQPQITIDGLYDADFPCPDKKSISEFTCAVEPIEKKLYKNSLQTSTLEKLRDTLLPKLMSGEVRVDYEP